MRLFQNTTQTTLWTDMYRVFKNNADNNCCHDTIKDHL